MMPIDNNRSCHGRISPAIGERSIWWRLNQRAVKESAGHDSAGIAFYQCDSQEAELEISEVERFVFHLASEKHRLSENSCLRRGYYGYACNGDTAAGTNFLLQPKATIDVSFNY